MKITGEKSKYHRFALNYEYAPDIVEFCRLLKESFGWQRFSYDTTSGTKRWCFSDSFLVTVIKGKYPSVEIDPLVWEIVKHEQKIVEEANTRAVEVEKIKQKTDTNFHVKGIKGELRNYQRIGVEFLVASKGRAILADEMGTGKSIQSLAYIVNSGFKRSLIVSPASVKHSWMSEVKKWTNMSAVVIDSKTKLHDIDPKINIWICNYDILIKHLPQLLKTHFDCIVGD